MNEPSQLIKNKYGFYWVKERPNKEELEKYYSEKYYQEAKGSYEIEYDAAEQQYFVNKIIQKAFVIEKNLDKDKPKYFLDIGCGEGWALSYFKEKKWQVLGLDYSSFGCQKFNPDCSENVIAGNVYENLDRLIEKGQKFDVVWVDNVLEHVTDPEFLVNNIKKIVSPKGILVIEVPNDFSVIQEYSLREGYIDRPFWVVIPDHLSYFNKEGLENLLHSNGWRTISVLGDYPIDWNLLNPNTNYVKDKTKGKSCHRERIVFENLLHKMPLEKVVDFYTSMADVGLGRSITGFFKLT
jgi:2-polyprenyl-3-methyl-5-hydroxy-6-metoxy-1,4-benzoquinol methylase